MQFLPLSIFLKRLLKSYQYTLIGAMMFIEYTSTKGWHNF